MVPPQVMGEKYDELESQMKILSNRDPKPTYQATVGGIRRSLTWHVRSQEMLEAIRVAVTGFAGADAWQVTPICPLEARAQT